MDAAEKRAEQDKQSLGIHLRRKNSCTFINGTIPLLEGLHSCACGTVEKRLQGALDCN